MTNEGALVAATSVETDRFSPTESLVGREDLVSLLNHCSAIGQGYIEVRLVDNAFPTLLVGFRKGFAVVQRMLDAESMTHEYRSFRHRGHPQQPFGGGQAAARYPVGRDEGRASGVHHPELA